ncbi:MAG TPA: GntR family transcriptional regulator [Pseudonocardiaceae bacterium]|jgi:GntR family transcriptional regulator|nr:GntR family transcriptional regulator [Pseudonocardiaceae bacterium]
MSDAGAVLRLPPFKVNRKLPLWYQVAQHLRATILASPHEGTSRLPVEEELAAHYGISVMTMRQALRELEDEGLITRQRRRGTFINPPTAPRPMRLLGSVDAVVVQQASAEVVVMEVESCSPPSEFAAYFPPEDGKVLRFRRLRKEGGVVTSYAENFVVAEIGTMIDVADLRTMPMTAVLRDRLNIRIGLIEDTAEATLPAPDIADLLEIPLTSPVLYCVGITHEVDGRVVDIASIHYRGDRFKFAVTFGTE